jgi:hypothetical protein
MPGKRRSIDARAADRETAQQLGEAWRPHLWHRVVVQHVIDALALARDSEEVSAASVAVTYLSILVELPPLSPMAPISVARVMARAGLSRNTMAPAIAALEKAGAIVCEREDGKPIVVRLPHYETSVGGPTRGTTHSEVAQLEVPPVVELRPGGPTRGTGVAQLEVPPNADRKPTQPETLPTPAPELITPPNPPHRERDLEHAFEVSPEDRSPSVQPPSNDVAGVHPVVSQMLLHLGVRGSTLARYAVAIGSMPRVAPVDVGPWIEAGKARGISSPDEWERWISAALRRRVLTPTQDPRNP